MKNNTKQTTIAKNMIFHWCWTIFFSNLSGFYFQYALFVCLSFHMCLSRWYRRYKCLIEIIVFFSMKNCECIYLWGDKKRKAECKKSTVINFLTLTHNCFVYGWIKTILSPQKPLVGVEKTLFNPKTSNIENTNKNVVEPPVYTRRKCRNAPQ